MGTAVFWGMLIATAAGVFIIPGNFVFVLSLFKGKKGTDVPAAPAAPAAKAPHAEAAH